MLGEKYRTKYPDKDSGSNASQSGSNSSKKEEEEEKGSSPYKCSRCGKTPLSGPVLYCDGCGQYMCYSCGIPSGDMVWECPNCAIAVHRVVL